MPSFPFALLFNPATLTGAGFFAVITIILAWLAAQIIQLAVHRYLDHAEARGVDSTSFRFLAQLGSVIVYIFAFFLYSHFIPALQSLGTAWLASVGVVSIVVGLATQSTLSNVVAGVSLVLYRPFRIGDRIQVTAPTGTEIGKVESVDLGYTSLLTSDGRRIVFPNSTIASVPSINFSRNNAHIPCDAQVTIAKDSDIGKARDLLLDIGKDIPLVKGIRGCFVTAIANAGITITLSTICLDPSDLSQVKSDILEKAKAALDKAGIALA